MLFRSGLWSGWNSQAWSQRNLADDVYDGVFERLIITSAKEGKESLIYSTELSGLDKWCFDAWIHQKFLGRKATFGDDRSLTNFILRHNRTAYQDTAICETIVPKSYKVFLKQQMRWKRSWLRESLIAARYMWKKEPLMALSFYFGLIVPIAAPIVVIYNLIYIPLMHRVFPTTFLVGMALMAMLMSMAQLFLRKKIGRASCRERV